MTEQSWEQQRATRQRLRRSIEREVHGLPDLYSEAIPGIECFVLLALLDNGDGIYVEGTGEDDVVLNTSQRVELAARLREIANALDEHAEPPWWRGAA